MIYSTQKQQKEYSVFSKFLVVLWYIVVIALLMYLCNPSWAQEVDHESVAHREVLSYIEDWTKDLSIKKQNKIKSYAIPVTIHSLNRGIDPLWVCEIISKESGWNIRAIGDRGEVGLMQTMTHANLKAFRLGYSLKTAEGQIVAGTIHLKEWIDKVHKKRPRANFEKVMKLSWAGYASGEMEFKWAKLPYRMKEYNRAVKRFRE